ncbi:Detected protein of unknown function [Hibiscus syriacus]|uniref:Pentatricopeptide repeat-containing protein n=1 Tax=Hibiscus syriacus TaxID=106335 RepID=A0A6A3B6D8_HIBSY|nr:Detected protein of unknown function [Hibiscus syriacus]
MLSMLEEIGARGVLTMDTFIISIKAFAAAKERKKGAEIFDLMKKYRYKAGVDTVNCFLESLRRAKLEKEVQALFEKLRDQFTPDLSSHTIMLNGWWSLYDYDSGVLQAGKDGRSGSIFQGDVSFWMSARYGGLHMFDNRFWKSEKDGHGLQVVEGDGDEGCPPDGHTYNALIKLLTTQPMPDDAMMVYKKMIQTGIQPTIHTFNMMMKSSFQSRNYDMSRAIWDEMTEKGYWPDDISYTVFIGGLICLGRSGEACRLLEEMIEKGMKARQFDYDKFAANFSRAGKPAIL